MKPTGLFLVLYSALLCHRNPLPHFNDFWLPSAFLHLPVLSEEVDDVKGRSIHQPDC